MSSHTDTLRERALDWAYAHVTEGANATSMEPWFEGAVEAFAAVRFQKLMAEADGARTEVERDRLADAA